MANTLAFQLYTLRNYEGGWEAAFEAVKGLGIDTVEAWSGAVTGNAVASTSIDNLRDVLSKTGMKLTCGHIAPEEFDNRYREWRNLLLDFGSKDWVIPFARAKSLGDWMALIPKFREMATRLKKDGLSLGYHNHHMELVKMGDKYVMEHLLDNMPELKVQFHMSQFIHERGIVLSDWIKKYEGRVCSLHVSDGDANGITGVGKGTCRAEDAIRTALDTGVETFIMEVRLEKETLEDVQRDIDFTRRLIG